MRYGFGMSSSSSIHSFIYCSINFNFSYAYIRLSKYLVVCTALTSAAFSLLKQSDFGKSNVKKTAYVHTRPTSQSSKSIEKRPDTFILPVDQHSIPIDTYSIQKRRGEQEMQKRRLEWKDTECKNSYAMDFSKVNNKRGVACRFIQYLFCMLTTNGRCFDGTSTSHHRHKQPHTRRRKFSKMVKH